MLKTAGTRANTGKSKKVKNLWGKCFAVKKILLSTLWKVPDGGILIANDLSVLPVLKERLTNHPIKKAMQKAKVYVAVLALSLLAACGGKMEDKSADPGYTGSADNISVNEPVGNTTGAKHEKKREINGEEGEPGGGIPKYSEKKLIKNGELRFQVNNMKESRQKIEDAIKENGGYISKENSWAYGDEPSENLIVRVPSKEFDKFLSEILNGVEKVDTKTIDVEDVTEQFIDVEARLASKKALEAKYKELLTKAQKMEDILNIEREMEVIREDIEAAEGRLKYLSNQVGYSTINITYYEHKVSGFNFGGKVGDALKDGSTGFLWFLIYMIQMWPMWLILGGITWLIVKVVKRKRARK
jgi:hypothetical protein